eukprot:m.461957 g.461957  ORF g.461957 m.461957 type:complete len:721 (+) comp22470_c0_seq1:232-2394(+)
MARAISRGLGQMVPWIMVLCVSGALGADPSIVTTTLVASTLPSNSTLPTETSQASASSLATTAVPSSSASASAVQSTATTQAASASTAETTVPTSSQMSTEASTVVTPSVNATQPASASTAETTVPTSSSTVASTPSTVAVQVSDSSTQPATTGNSSSSPSSTASLSTSESTAASTSSVASTTVASAVNSTSSSELTSTASVSTSAASTSAASTARSTASSVASTTVDPCTAFDCVLECNGTCGWAYAANECRTNEHTSTSELQLRLGNCSRFDSTPAPASPNTAPTSEDQCGNYTCVWDCRGLCGWDLEYDVCRTGYTTSDAVLALGIGCTSTSSTAPPTVGPQPTNPPGTTSPPVSSAPSRSPTTTTAAATTVAAAGTTVRSCRDSDTYRDPSNFGCADWRSYSCLTAASLFGFSTSQQADLIRNCPAACGLCAFGVTTARPTVALTTIPTTTADSNDNDEDDNVPTCVHTARSCRYTHLPCCSNAHECRWRNGHKLCLLKLNSTGTNRTAANVSTTTRSTAAPNTTTVVAGQCMDTDGWRDLRNRSCSDYGDRRLCYANGTAGPGWAGTWANKQQRYMLHGHSLTGVRAATACCVCGGGTFGVTTVAPTTSKSNSTNTATHDDGGVETNDAEKHGTSKAVTAGRVLWPLAIMACVVVMAIYTYRARNTRSKARYNSLHDKLAGEADYGEDTFGLGMRTDMMSTSSYEDDEDNMIWRR